MVQRSHGRGWWGWLLALACVAAQAQQLLAVKFQPDLRVYPQFFSLVQGVEGDLLIGGIDGVLRFDGGRWHWLALPRPGAVRALLAGSDGRTWVGAANSFGYIERSDSGRERYVDVSAQFEADLQGRRFADVWEVIDAGDTVYFRALYDVFAVGKDGRRRGFWHHPGRFGGIAWVDGEVWLQWRGQGLKVLRGQDFELLPGGARFATSLIYNLLPLADGRVLLHDVRPSLSFWQDGAFVDRTTPELARELAEAGRGELFDAGHAVLAASDGALRVLDLALGTVEKVPLGNHFLVDVIRARDGSLLALDLSGVSRLDWPPSWRRADPATAEVGGIYALDQSAGTLYASTWNGVFAKPLAGEDGLRRMLPAEAADAEYWGVHGDHGDLLLASSKQLFRLRAGVMTALSDDGLYPRQFLPDPLDPALLWIGTEHGPALFARPDGEWRLRGQQSSPGWQIASMSAFAGSIWLGSGDRGVHRLRRDDADPGDWRFEAVGDASGLPASAELPALVSMFDGALYVSLARGLYRNDGERFRSDDADGLAALLDENEQVLFRTGADGSAWAFSYHSVYRHDAGRGWSVVLLGGVHTGAVYDLLPQSRDAAFVGSESGLLRYAPMPTAARPEASSLRPRISAARVLHGRAAPLDLPLNRPAQVQLNGGSLEFEFAYPRLDGVGVSEFQFTLDPDGRTWSPWRNRASAAFFALAPGDYRLRMRARSRYGPSAEAAAFEFNIVPRWYQRAWVVPLAVVLLVGLLALALVQRQRLKVRRLRASNRELDAQVQTRTRELQHANEQLRGLAQSDGLTGLANRRHFDDELARSSAAVLAAARPLSLLFADVDHFKAYNDDRGHQAGDDVLRTVARVLRDVVPREQLVARYGGEEFAVVAAGLDAAAAGQLAERIRAAVAAALSGVTISIGIATRPGDREESAAALIARADAALYRAKHLGRNRVERAADAA